MMSPVIRISDETFEKLQLLAKPFVDTPDSVIARLVDEALRAGPARPTNGKHAPSPANSLEINPESPDNLTHTRVRYAQFGERVVDQPNWNELLRTAHAVALEALGSFQALRKASGANIREGKYSGEGFSYVPDAGISIQGADANKSWANALRLAQTIGVPVEAQFEWYNKDNAAHPGKQARIRWSPKS